MTNYINLIAILMIILIALLVMIARNVNWLSETTDLRQLISSLFKAILSLFKTRKTKTNTNY